MSGEELSRAVLDRLRVLESASREHGERLAELETVIASAARALGRALYIVTVGVPLLIQVLELLFRRIRAGG